MYLYANASPGVYSDSSGLAPCFALMCIPGFMHDDRVKSELVQEGKWRLVNWHEEPGRFPQGPVLPEGGPLGIPGQISGAVIAICIFGKTDTYKDEFHRWRRVRCLEVCPSFCGAPPSFEWNSRIEDFGNYFKERIEHYMSTRIILLAMLATGVLVGCDPHASQGERNPVEYDLRSAADPAVPRDVAGADEVRRILSLDARQMISALNELGVDGRMRRQLRSWSQPGKECAAKSRT